MQALPITPLEIRHQQWLELGETGTAFLKGIARILGVEGVKRFLDAPIYGYNSRDDLIAKRERHEAKKRYFTNHDNCERFRKNLIHFRENMGLSPKELANILGVIPSTIRAYESGRYRPRLSVLKKLADIFHVTVDDLVFRDLVGDT